MAKKEHYISINDSSRYDEFCQRVNEFRERDNWKKCNRSDVRRYRSYAKLVGRRFYVSSKKYYIEEHLQCPENDYLKVELIDFITKERITFDVMELLRSVYAINKEHYDVSRKDDKEYLLELLYNKCSYIASNADVNVALSKEVKERPDISDKELVDTFLYIVGNGQIYFQTKEIYRHKYCCSRSRFLLDEILDVHCAYNTKRNHRNLEYIPGTIYEKEDAIKEIEDNFGEYIDKVLSHRDMSRPVLAIGLDSFNFSAQNSLICFARSHEEDDIAWRFYTHYEASWAKVSPNNTNEEIREFLIDYIFRFFYKERFKKRIEGTRKYHEGK